MPEEQNRDWLKFAIHLFFGALLGAFVGFVAWGKSSYHSSTSMLPGVIFIGGGALLFGVAAGVAAHSGDHFWHSFGDWFRRW